MCSSPAMGLPPFRGFGEHGVKACGSVHQQGKLALFCNVIVLYVLASSLVFKEQSPFEREIMK